MLNQINEFFGIFVGAIAPILFMQVNGFPLIVLVLLSGGLIFTLYFKFINVRGFRHAIDILKVNMTIRMISAKLVIFRL